MKILTANIDFKIPCDLSDLKVNDKVLIKSAFASGWAKVGIITRIMKSQIEVEIINVIPTIDSNSFGTINHFEERREGFFEYWADMKKYNKGRKRKFFIDSNREVGFTHVWNPSLIAIFI